MFGFGNDKKKWADEHSDMPEDAYVQISGTMGKDKYGNEFRLADIENTKSQWPFNQSQQAGENRILTIQDIVQRLDRIESLLKTIKKSKVKIKLTDEQHEQLEKLVQDGTYKTKEEAIKDMLVD